MNAKEPLLLVLFHNFKIKIMSFITPQLELNLQVNVDGTKELILHSESSFNGVNYIANGHHPIPTSLDVNNILQISLLILESENGSNMVSHTVELGKLNFDVEEFTIQVSLYNQQNKLKGKGDIRNTTAKEMGRPIPRTPNN